MVVTLGNAVVRIRLALVLVLLYAAFPLAAQAFCAVNDSNQLMLLDVDETSGRFWEDLAPGDRFCCETRTDPYCNVGDRRTVKFEVTHYAGPSYGAGDKVSGPGDRDKGTYVVCTGVVPITGTIKIVGEMEAWTCKVAGEHGTYLKGHQERQQPGRYSGYTALKLCNRSRKRKNYLEAAVMYQDPVLGWVSRGWYPIVRDRCSDIKLPDNYDAKTLVHVKSGRLAGDNQLRKMCVRRHRGKFVKEMENNPQCRLLRGYRKVDAKMYQIKAGQVKTIIVN